MTVKRSLSIQGHRTSISVEDEFWTVLKAMALRRGLPLPTLVAEIDAGREQGANLSSAIRLAVIADLQNAAASGSPAEATTPIRPVFSHVHIGTADFDAAYSFWAPLADALGLRPRFHEPAAGWAGWQPPAGDRPLFLVGRPYDGGPPEPGNGPMVAFLAPSRAGVDRIFDMAIEAGGRSEGEPGLRPHYHPHYYGAYFRDPDGNKICLCCHDAPSELSTPGPA